MAVELPAKVYGGEEFGAWVLLDSDRMYILASGLSMERSRGEQDTALQKASGATLTPPERIVLGHYSMFEDSARGSFQEATLEIQDRQVVERGEILPEGLSRALGSQVRRLRRMRGKEKASLHIYGWLLFYNFPEGHPDVV